MSLSLSFVTYPASSFYIPPHGAICSFMKGPHVLPDLYHVLVLPHLFCLFTPFCLLDLAQA